MLNNMLFIFIYVRIFYSRSQEKQKEPVLFLLFRRFLFMIHSKYIIVGFLQLRKFAAGSFPGFSEFLRGGPFSSCPLFPPLCITKLVYLRAFPKEVTYTSLTTSTSTSQYVWFVCICRCVCT